LDKELFWGSTLHLLVAGVSRWSEPITNSESSQNHLELLLTL